MENLKMQPRELCHGESSFVLACYLRGCKPCTKVNFGVEFHEFPLTTLHGDAGDRYVFRFVTCGSLFNSYIKVFFMFNVKFDQLTSESQYTKSNTHLVTTDRNRVANALRTKCVRYESYFIISYEELQSYILLICKIHRSFRLSVYNSGRVPQPAESAFLADSALLSNAPANHIHEYHHHGLYFHVSKNVVQLSDICVRTLASPHCSHHCSRCSSEHRNISELN